MSEGRSDSNEAKWTCEYCTYENWPSSLKCTMCRGAKPLLGEDIYRLRDTSPQRSGSSVASGPAPQYEAYNAHNNCSQNVPSCGKWSCEMCTYLNYQNATRCTQCSTRRPPSHSSHSINSAASNLHEQLAPLRLGEQPNMETNSQTNPSPINLHPERHHNTQPTQEKWHCAVCTYENWPKATKCIMCGQQKETRERRDRGVGSGPLILPSPEREHGQRTAVSSPPLTPYLHQATREENVATNRR